MKKNKRDPGAFPAACTVMHPTPAPPTTSSYSTPASAFRRTAATLGATTRTHPPPPSCPPPFHTNTHRAVDTTDT